VQVVTIDPIKPKLKRSLTKLLKLKCDIRLSTDAFMFNLRRYTMYATDAPDFGAASDGDGDRNMILGMAVHVETCVRKHGMTHCWRV